MRERGRGDGRGKEGRDGKGGKGSMRWIGQTHLYINVTRP